MDNERLNSRAQAMLWVIVALAIGIIIILLFIFRGKITEIITPGGNEENPELYIDNCVKESVDEVVDVILPQGGFVEPQHGVMYQGKNISYLCYNSGNYNPCVNEHPLYVTEVKREIENYITPKLEECFEDYRIAMEKRDSVVNFGIMDVDVKLSPNRIFVLIERDVNIESNGESRNYNKFDVEIINPTYNLARVAAEIASQEAEYCYFEYVGYMILYPKFKISRDIMSDSTKIYSITDKRSGKELNIAIRSCAIPPGF